MGLFEEMIGLTTAMSYIYGSNLNNRLMGPVSYHRSHKVMCCRNAAEWAAYAVLSEEGANSAVNTEGNYIESKITNFNFSKSYITLVEDRDNFEKVLQDSRAI